MPEIIQQSRSRKIAYWITTVLLSITMLNGGIYDLLRNPPYYDMLLKMGYPGYFSLILGSWKLLGTVTILIPGFPRVKEWAYSGFIILLVCAICSRIGTGGPVIGYVFDVIFIGITATSYLLRPANRKLEGPLF